MVQSRVNWFGSIKYKTFPSQFIDDLMKEYTYENHKPSCRSCNLGEHVGTPQKGFMSEKLE